MSIHDFKVAVIGTGTVFNSHMHAYKKMGVKVVAVSDIDEQAAAAAASRFSIAHCLRDWRELLSRDIIDVVDICTPPKFHSEQITEALAAHKNVVCEKPVAVNLMQSDEILKIEKNYKTKLGVVHQFRASPAYQRLKWIVESGCLGRICSVHLRRNDSPPSYLVEAGKWGVWDLNGGGVLMTMGIHQLDLLLWLFGEAEQVSAMMDTFFLPIEGEDYVSALVKFSNGVRANLRLSASNFPPFGEAVEIMGKKGRVKIPWELSLLDSSEEKRINGKLDQLYPMDNQITLFRRIFNKAAHLLYATHPNNGRSGYVSPYHEPFLKDFLESVDRDASPHVTVREARKAVELCVAIYSAAILRETVFLPLACSSDFYTGITKDNYNGRTKEGRNFNFI